MACAQVTTADFLEPNGFSVRFRARATTLRARCSLRQSWSS